jgi:hypothetical protein
MHESPHGSGGLKSALQPQRQPDCFQKGGQCMRFKKGQSGNPAGRPQGSRNHAATRIRDLLGPKTGEIVNKLTDMALAGNIGAIRLCLDRLVPTGKYEPLLCEMRPLAKAADAVGAMAGLASAAAAGEVTADEAAKFAKMISVYVDTLEAHDFEERLTKLEQTDVQSAAGMRNASDHACDQ